MNFDIKVVEASLEEICEHSLFLKSINYTRLLRYLVDKAIKNEDVKEFTIGCDLLSKNYLDDKNDGAVRSQMYKLRKKLTAYYADKSVQHDVIFEIKKGQYNLSFLSPKEFNQDNEKGGSISIPLKKIKIAFLFLPILLIGFWSFVNFFNQPSSLWKNYFKSNSNNLVVISDQYVVMSEGLDGKSHATLFGNINSDADLINFKNKNKQGKFDNTDFTLMSKMAPYGTKILNDWFNKYNSNFALRLESTLTMDDIKNNNVVFIGQFKTMNISSALFLKDSHVFSIYKDGFIYKKDDKEKEYNTIFNSKSKIEYAMVSCKWLDSGKNSFYFVSNNDIGVLATLGLFTDNKWLSEFYERLPEKAIGFNALFEVSGLQRTDMGCKLVELEVLN
ncbi:hypothetical protein [Algibacter mikhailovii]|uniref:hypothetical protein n=1 Tax=Algibacter mikhailovii TaxID=425498 RepID=UPI0024941443|nr:hypothetical protein [Algibacter mikhailovii]